MGGMRYDLAGGPADSECARRPIKPSKFAPKFREGYVDVGRRNFVTSGPRAHFVISNFARCAKSTLIKHAVGFTLFRGLKMLARRRPLARNKRR